MTLLSLPPVSRDGSPPPDDVDRLLRAFFRAQMPDPWPSPEAPAPRRVAPLPAAKPSTRWPLMRSRLALAASVALLATGLLFVAGPFQGKPDAGTGVAPVTRPTASRENDPLYSRPAPKDDVQIHLIQPSGGATIIKVDVIPLDAPMK